MVSKRLLLFAVVVMLATMVVAIPSVGAAQPEAAPIRLAAATFTPALGERPDIPPGLTIAGPAAGQRGYYLVQFAGPVEQSWKDAVEAAGGELLDYVPDYAFKTRMTPAGSRRVAALDAVAWVDVFHPAYKISPEAATEDGGLYRIRVERGADAGLATAAVAATGATVLDHSENVLLVGADAVQVAAIAHVADVAWIERYVFAEKHNEYGAGVIIGANTANANGYDGSTQTAAVSDTGIGDGTAAGAHADIPGSRIVNIYNWPGSAGGCFTSLTDDGPVDVDSGHGTHTAVSVLGDGGAAGEGRGTAPAANLVFQATENWVTIDLFCQILGGLPPSGYFLTGLPSDLGTMYQQAYNAGARIHSNSWGSAQAGAYTADSANTDSFVWDNADMMITFSAGNSGVDNNLNGVVDNDSIGSPASAKNVLTVGASEGDRPDGFPCDTGLAYTSSDPYQPGETCASMGGTNLLGTAGSRWGFLAEPLASDVTAGNAEQMAPFSSRGPTDDGRIKPDVVAPGTWILSGYSSRYQQGYGDPTNPQTGGYQWDGWGMPLNDDYKYMGGTSMSNPIAAGAATVVRDFYQKAHGHNASAALVKATLINSARDLLDENNDGADDNDYPIPNVHEGWGIVDLVNATDGSAEYVDNTAGLATGGSSIHQFTATGGAPLKVSLVWSDYPSSELAALNLVNNLDLVVTAPGGAQYRGNVFSGGWSLTGGAADTVNNVENVYVQSAAAGTWTVEVVGANVPYGPQPFALVVDGGSGGTSNTLPSVSIVEPAGGATVSSTVTVGIDASDAEDDPGTLNVSWNVDGGAWLPAAYDAASDRYLASWDTTTAGDGPHTINARAVDSGSATGFDAVGVTVSNEPASVHVGDLDAASSSAPRNRWNAAVTVTVHDGDEVPVPGAGVTGSWSNGAAGSASCTTDASGTCTVTKSNVKGNVASVTFTVDTVTSGVGAYDPAANHDPDGDGDGTSIVVSKDGTPPPPPPTGNGSLHVGALSGMSLPDGRNWIAMAIVIVVDGNDNLVGEGATISGVWSDGAKGGGACTTDGLSGCAITKSVRGNVAQVTFTVTDITNPAGDAYDPAANAATSITIPAPL